MFLSMMDVIEMYTETRAMVLTTHMMEEVEGICEKVGIMVNGDFACVNTINGLINQTNEGKLPDFLPLQMFPLVRLPN